ncbi:MAG: LysR family transcriptional regulator [Leucobacter sp.]
MALEALLSERNVTRAAARAFVGQSTMSATLSRLRTLFDDPLLVREGRYLVTTPFADSLLGPLRDSLQQLEWLVSRSHDFDPRTAQRTFSIMATDYIPPIFLHPLLDWFSREAPCIEVRFLAADSKAGERLSSGDVDLLLHPRDMLPDAQRFHQQVLFREPYFLVAARSNTQIGSVVTEAQFASLPYLAMTIDSRPSYADTQLEAMGIIPNRAVEASGAMGPFLIRETHLVTIAHESLARFAVCETGALRLLPVPVRLNPLTEAMFWLPRYTQDPGHRWLRDRIRAVISGVNAEFVGGIEADRSGGVDSLERIDRTALSRQLAADRGIALIDT